MSEADRRGTIRNNIKKVYWPGLAILLLFIALSTHWPLRKAFFQTDDFIWLRLANWRSIVGSFVGNQGETIAYRPIFRLSTYIDYLIFGQNAALWHFENVVLHAANALVLAAILRIYRLSTGSAAVAAILFVLAPLSDESVNWISGRGSVLCFFFMLLSLWRWTIALRDHKRPWAAMVWMVLAGMTYEAAIALPVVMTCLTPLVCQRFSVDWRFAARQMTMMLGLFVIFWLARAGFLGTFTGSVSEASSDLIGNFIHHFVSFGGFTRLAGGTRLLALLAAVITITLLSRRFFVASVSLLIVAVVLLLPFSTIVGVGGRFFYMMQAPFCVLAVLPGLLIPKVVRGPIVVLLLGLVLPSFAKTDWHQAFAFARAGNSTRALIGAVVEAIVSGACGPR